MNKPIISNVPFSSFGDAKRDGSIVKSNDWHTPPEIFNELGIKFDLDVASPIGGVSWIPADNYYTEIQDGLKKEWYGRVWCNPPYGRETNKWLNKFINHNNGIALVFARTDTQWFNEIALKGDAINFKQKRISFYNPNFKKNTSGTGSMFIAMGKECVNAIKKIDGWFVLLNKDFENG